MNRRESFVGHTVSYAAVGASDGPDLMRFPPEGATPFQEELRLGSGADRFLIASSALMTWGAQRVNGIEIVEVSAGDGGQYQALTFDEDGVPQPPAPEDLQFSPEGTPYLRAGSVVKMVWADSRPDLTFRVVYTFDETKQVAFAVGSADNESVPGEVRYSVEHRDDDSVWGTVRGFLFPPATGLLGWKGRGEARAVIAEVTAQLNGLTPGTAPTVTSAEQSEHTGGVEGETDDNLPEQPPVAADDKQRAGSEQVDQA